MVKKTQVKFKKAKKCRDEAARKFILSHLRQEPIDFSEIKIPNFLRMIESEINAEKAITEETPNSNEDLKKEKNLPELPIFGLSLLDIFQGKEGNSPILSSINK